MSITFKRISIGFLAIIIFVFFWGNLIDDDIIPFFFASLICTMGASLIVYIPLAYFIGYAISFRFIKDEAPKVKANTAGNITNEDRALIQYIFQARGGGMADQEIRLKLMSNGWGNEAIERAFGITG